MSPVIRTDRDDNSGDLIRTHEDGTVSVLNGYLHDLGYWATDPRFVGTGGRPILDERGNGICGTCGAPVPAPTGPWDGETRRGGYSVHYGHDGASVASVRCPRHDDFLVAGEDRG